MPSDDHNPAHVVYSSQLLVKRLGHALYYPHPGKNRKPIEIADVGYFEEGVWKGLFNASKPEGDSKNRLGVPTGYKQLEFSSDLITETPFNPIGPFKSEHVLEVGGELSVSIAFIGGGGGGGGIRFRCSKNKGAVLVPIDPALINQDMDAKRLFFDYMLENHASWVDFYNKYCFFTDSNLVFVTGCHKTSAWACAAFHRTSAEISLDLQLDAGLGGGRVGIWGQRSVSQSVDAHSYQGPSRDYSPLLIAQSDSEASQDNSESQESATEIVISKLSSSSLSAGGALTRDQCVFLRGYKMAKRTIFERLTKSDDGFEYVKPKIKHGKRDPDLTLSGTSGPPSDRSDDSGDGPNSSAGGAGGQGNSPSGTSGPSGRSNDHRTDSDPHQGDGGKQGKQRHCSEDTCGTSDPIAADDLEAEGANYEVDEDLDAYLELNRGNDFTHLDMLLGYIFKTSNAEIALVHDHDFIDLLEKNPHKLPGGYQVQEICDWLYDVSPDVHMIEKDRIGVLDSTYMVAYNRTEVEMSAMVPESSASCRVEHAEVVEMPQDHTLQTPTHQTTPQSPGQPHRPAGTTDPIHRHHGHDSHASFRDDKTTSKQYASESEHQTDTSTVISPEDAARLSDHLDPPGQLNDIGNSYLCRFKRLGDITDLNKALSAHEEAARMTPVGLNRPGQLNDLGISYVCRFKRLGDISDLDTAIWAHEEAVRLTPNEHPDKPLRLNNLGNSHLSRFMRLGDISNLDQAILAHEEAMQLTPNDHANRPGRLNNLGNSRLRRFKRLGYISDLDEAIAARGEALRLTPDGHPDRPGRLNNLGNSYLCRFERLAHISDLERAISLQGDAVRLTPDSHPDKPQLLNNFGNSHRLQFEHLGDTTDLDRAISAHEYAVRLTPDDHPARPRYLNSLGHSIHLRFDRFGDIADLDRAISLEADVARLTPDSHPDKSRHMSNLENSSLHRFHRFRNFITVPPGQPRSFALT